LLIRVADAFNLYFLKAKNAAWVHGLITLSQKMPLAAQEGGFKKNLKSLPA
jgi:hypothetical protein